MGGLADDLKAMRENGVARIELHENGTIKHVEFAGVSEAGQGGSSIDPRPPVGQSPNALDQPARKKPDAIRDVVLAELPALEPDANDFPPAVIEEVEDAPQV